MKRIILLITASIFLASCENIPQIIGEVPLIGRKQVLLVSNSDMLALSIQSYNDFLGSSTLSTNTAQTALVKNVGAKIAAEVEKYLRNNKLEKEISGFAWEFNLVKDNQVNAFCMPGGKVVFYEGILPYTKDETGIAVVMGHEIAHAVAKHSNERMSQEMLIQYGGALASNVLFSEKSQWFDMLYGLGTQVGVTLPFSRKQEYEADRLGAIFMAMAGYDPNEAINFWERMSDGSTSTFDFMSTHPSDANRIKELKELMPEAMKYYKNN